MSLFLLQVLFNFSHFKPMTGRMHFLLTSLPSTGVDGFSNSVNLDVVIPRATPVRSGDGVYCRLIHTTTPPSFSAEMTTVLPTKSVSQELYWSAVGLLAAVTTLLIIILIYVGCKRMRKHPRHGELLLINGCLFCILLSKVSKNALVICIVSALVAR